MKAISLREFGDPDGLAVVDLPRPVPGEGEVLLAPEAIGVGGVDAVVRRWGLSAHGFERGHIPGSEVAGTVTGVGEGVDDSWIGKRVWAFTGLGGGYVEEAAVSAEQVVPLPAGLSAADAVTLGGSGVVAHFALAHAHFAPGEAVLVRGAAGGIGVLAVQLAAGRGAGDVAVTTSSAERGERLRGLGATHVLDRSGEGEGPDGYDVVVDVVAGPGVPSFFRRLRPNGRMVAVGIVGGELPAELGTELSKAFRKSLSFATFSADTVPPAEQRAVREGQFAAAVRGELHSVVHELLPLERAAEAHRKMDAGEVFGRIVLTP